MVLWRWSDSLFNTSPLKSHTFQTPGLYGTELIVLNTFNQCQDTLNLDSIISVFNLSPDFSADTTFGCTPLNVSFLIKALPIFQ